MEKVLEQNDILEQTSLLDEVVEKESVKRSKLVLPMMFCSSIVFIGFINISNFKNSYRTAKEENPNNKQVALSTVEKKYAGGFLGKNNYVNLNGGFARVIDKKELNGIVKLENGYLTGLVGEVDTKPLVENAVEFRDYLNEKHIPFLYVQAPHKVPSNDLNLPKGFKNYANKNTDELLKGLDNNNIETLDLRNEIEIDKLNHYKLFYKTDHHWNNYAGFWAHSKIMNIINDTLEISKNNTECTDINNYNIEKYEEEFIGSRGSRVGRIFGGVDYVDFIYPKFDTDMILEVPSKNIKREGEFDESVGFKDTRGYYVYFNGLQDYAKITNNKSTNEKKIFVLGDSFNVPTLPFLALHYNEIHWFDLRRGSSTDMLKKIEEVKPDIVIAHYYPGELNGPLMDFINDDAEKYLEEKKQQEENIEE